MCYRREVTCVTMLFKRELNTQDNQTPSYPIKGLEILLTRLCPLYWSMEPWVGFHSAAVKRSSIRVWRIIYSMALCSHCAVLLLRTSFLPVYYANGPLPPCMGSDNHFYQTSLTCDLNDIHPWNPKNNKIITEDHFYNILTLPHN